MVYRIIAIFLLLYGQAALSEDFFLATIKKKAKFPESVVTKDVAFYHDKTVCGRWTGKDSFGIFASPSDFVFFNNVLFDQSIAENPLCSNLSNKIQLHKIWLKLNGAKLRRSKIELEINNISKGFDSYCKNTVIRSLCEDYAYKWNNKLPSLRSEMTDTVEEIENLNLEFDSLKDSASLNRPVN